VNPNSEDHVTANAEKTETGAAPPVAKTPREVGGRQGPDPTRYGDWELRGRCIDF
jgi:hypothetical protein